MSYRDKPGSDKCAYPDAKVTVEGKDLGKKGEVRDANGEELVEGDRVALYYEKHGLDITEKRVEKVGGDCGIGYSVESVSERSEELLQIVAEGSVKEVERVYLRTPTDSEHDPGDREARLSLTDAVVRDYSPPSDEHTVDDMELLPDEVDESDLGMDLGDLEVGMYVEFVMTFRLCVGEIKELPPIEWRNVFDEKEVIKDSVIVERVGRGLDRDINLIMPVDKLVREVNQDRLEDQ